MPLAQAGHNGPGTPFSSAANISNIPPGCIRDMSATNPANTCYHMRTGLNALDSPVIDVLILVPVSPTVERDSRIIRQSIEMWDAGIDYLANQKGLAWLADGTEFHITVDNFDPVNGYGGEFTTYPIVDPEIVVIASNPVGGAGIGIDPLGLNFCHGIANPLDMDGWEALPGFNSHHSGRSGTYVEDCGGRGGNICFAINGAIDPLPENFDFFQLYDLVSHEFGHCLTLGHVGDGAEGSWGVVPTNDIMAYSQDPPGKNKCVSTLDVEAFAIRMSGYLDVNGDGAINGADKLYANDHLGQGGNPFQIQHPSNHFYASTTGKASDCPQPDKGLVPFGEPVNFNPGGGEPVGEPTVTILSPTDGSDVEASFTVSGEVDRDAVNGGQSLAVGAGGPYSGTAGSPIAIAATVEGGDGGHACTWSGASATFATSGNNCAGTVTFAAASTYTITVTATETGYEGSSADATVTVTSSGGGAGLPTPDGTITGGITVFSDLNPLLAHNELASIATGATGDPRPKFTAGEPVTFHSRFSDDSQGRVAVGISTFTWTVFDAAGETMSSFGCTTAADSNAATGPDGFDCEGSTTLPSEPGIYFASANLDGTSAWIKDTPSDDPDHPGLKGIEVLGTPEPAPARIAATGALPAPSAAPANAEITDPAGDAVVSSGSPLTQMDIRAGWFDEDSDALYVGLQVEDIPADSTTTAFINYAVNFKPDWVTTWPGVPAANTFTGLRVTALYSPVFLDDLTPGTSSATRFELQHLSTSSSGSNFGTVAVLGESTLDVDTDIIWWVIPKASLEGVDVGDHLMNLGAAVAPAVGGVVTFGTALGDSAASSQTYTFTNGVIVDPPGVERVEIYEGATLLATSQQLNTVGTTTPAAWTSEVTLVGTGAHTLTAKWIDAEDTLLDTATVTVQVVEANQAPVLAPIGDQTVAEANALEFTLSASDADGDELTFSASNLPDGASLAGDVFSWTPTYEQAGTYTVGFAVSDGSLSDEETVTITVENTNRAPVVTDIEDQQADARQEIRFTVSANDPDGDVLELEAENLPEGAIFDDATSEFVWTPKNKDAGTYTLTFTANDGDLVGSDTVTLTVVKHKGSPT